MQNGIEKCNKILRTYDKIKYLTFQEKKKNISYQIFFPKTLFSIIFRGVSLEPVSQNV